jgi:hypothetical protein
MDSLRIIDIWQVITQEPQVAREEAVLLLTTELQRKYSQDRVNTQKRIQREKIQQSNKSEQRRVVSDKEERSSRYIALRTKNNKKKFLVGVVSEDEYTKTAENRTIDIRV